MSGYIDRDLTLAGIEDLKKSPWYNGCNGNYERLIRREAVDIVTELCIKQVPAADVVEVVRCKDCENCICINDRYMCKRNAIYDNRNDEFHGLCAVKKEHFCSYGERKDKE